MAGRCMLSKGAGQSNARWSRAAAAGFGRKLFRGSLMESLSSPIPAMNSQRAPALSRNFAATGEAPDDPEVSQWQEARAALHPSPTSHLFSPFLWRKQQSRNEQYRTEGGGVFWLSGNRFREGEAVLRGDLGVERRSFV